MNLGIDLAAFWGLAFAMLAGPALLVSAICLTRKKTLLTKTWKVIKNERERLISATAAIVAAVLVIALALTENPKDQFITECKSNSHSYETCESEWKDRSNP